MKVVSDEGSGPVAVLLHGQPGDADDFTLVCLALRDKGLRVIAVDRPGYDAATPATGYAGNAAALAGLLDDLGVASARLLGLSWSGGVALRFALAYPDRVDGLLLAASVGAPESVVPSDRLMALPVAVTISKLMAPRLAGLLERASGSRLDPAARSLTRAAALRWSGTGGWDAFAVEQRALVRDTAPLWESLAPQAFPVTVVQGTRDGYVPVNAGRLLAGRLAARYVEVEAGHLLHLEVPALLAEELVNLGSNA